MGRPLNLHRLGGDTAATGKQLQVKAKLSSGAAANGFLVKQKNQTSFHVTVGAATEICKFVDKATASLLAGEMNLRVTPASGPAFFTRKITNRFVWDFAGNRYMWAMDPTTGKVTADAA